VRLFLPGLHHHGCQFFAAPRIFIVGFDGVIAGSFQNRIANGGELLDGGIGKLFPAVDAGCFDACFLERFPVADTAKVLFF